MGCRSCGLGPSPVKVSEVKPRSNNIVTKSTSNKQKLEGVETKKTSIPTRSPPRTFPNAGE